MVVGFVAVQSSTHEGEAGGVVSVKRWECGRISHQVYDYSTFVS